MSWSCPRCASTLYPGFVLNDAMKMQATCSACGATDPSTTAADMNVGIASVEDVSSAGPGWGGKKQQVVAVGARAAVANGSVSIEMPRVAAPQITRQSTRHMPIQERIAGLAAEEARLTGEIAEARARLAGVRAERRTLAKLSAPSLIEHAPDGVALKN